MAAVFVFIGQRETEEVVFGGDIFDISQYLFGEQNKISVNINMGITGGSVLEPSAPPFLVSGNVLGALSGIIEPEADKEIIKYVVKQGDTLSSIADSFNISLETLYWANNLGSRSVLRIGQELNILPVSGLLHIVREGDTISEIAQLYSVKSEEVIAFNDLEGGGMIIAGDILIVPGGKKPKIDPNYVQVPLSGSYFICPIPSPCRVTQGLHWYNAVDFSNNKCGEPVFAAAGGTVQRTGYTRLGGNYARVMHPNGVITYYGHLSKISVNPGEKVYQGQIIGYVGYSGVTVPAGPEGCHLHFDVRFAENPFSQYSAGDKLGN